MSVQTPTPLTAEGPLERMMSKPHPVWGHLRDPWTGKPVDSLSDLLPSPNGEKCDHCGGDCIDRCVMCGAPQCCPACCIESREDAQ